MKESLINKELVNNLIKVAYSQYHGASESFLGMGLIYYSLAYVFKSTLSVCLGSGGGYVPMLMKQAQRDLELADSSTYLVDANRPENGWGSPQVPNGWLDENSLLNKKYDDIIVINDLTLNACKLFLGKNDKKIQYLHIDADHTMDGCIEDFIAYEPALDDNSIVSIHDTRYSSIQRAIGYIRQSYPLYDIIDFPDIAQGTALVKKRLPYNSQTSIDGGRPNPQKDVDAAELKRMLKIIERNKDGKTK